jgi:BirA family biotin operon repressor/biotin-[acetyl-CoA-carboxylase] ligase
LTGSLTLPPRFRHLHLAETGSTNDEVRNAALRGKPEGLVVTADVQTAGRGRRGREWSSPSGNLYSSVLLRPAVPPAVGAQLSFIAALAVAEAVAELLPGAPLVNCKWPNDVLVNGAKIAGILLESQTGAGGRLDWVVIGAGVNVTSHPQLAAYPATSLAANGATAAAKDVLARYLHRLDHWLVRWAEAGFAPVRDAWLARAWRLGATIAVKAGERPLEGVFETLDEAGALVLAARDGRRQIFSAGEIAASA